MTSNDQRIPRKKKTNQDITFEQFKKSILFALANPEETDKSRKGSVDAPIVNLIETINKSTDFVTTSSCSGRIVLFEQAKDASFSEIEQDASPLPSSSSSTTPLDSPDPSSSSATKTKAGSGGWILAEHALVTFDQIKSALQSFVDSQAGKSSSIVWIRHEPFILHVQCRNLDAAQALHLIAREAGFRESGITVGRKKIMLAIRTTALMLVAPVVIHGELAVNFDHLRTLVEIACQMFHQNTTMRSKFETQFIQKFGWINK